MRGASFFVNSALMRGLDFTPTPEFERSGDSVTPEFSTFGHTVGHTLLVLISIGRNLNSAGFASVRAFQAALSSEAQWALDSKR